MGKIFKKKPDAQDGKQVVFFKYELLDERKNLGYTDTNDYKEKISAMEKNSRKIKEYGFMDFVKVLRKNWLALALCVVLTGVVVGGALGCVSAFVQHNEYSATIAKVDTTTFDVPIVRATFRERIRLILEEKYPNRGLSQKDFSDLSRAVDDHLDIDESSEGTYTFTLSSFNAKQTTITDNEFADILNAIIDWFKQLYTEKIVTSYVIRSTAISDNTKALTYYLQVQALETTIDSLIEEVETVAGMKQVPGIDITDSTVSSAVTVERSEFAAYYCEENGKRVSDILIDLKNLYSSLSSVRLFICNNGVEKPDATTTMSEYIDGELFKYPSGEENAVLTGLKDKFGADSVYNQADEAGKQNLETGAQTRIDGVVSSLQTILDNYNLIAQSYARSTIPDYVVISALATDEDLGAIEPIAVVLITAACVIVAFLIGFFGFFSRMQKTGEIGTELVEETDEEA